jgi:hypothetical protein
VRTNSKLLGVTRLGAFFKAEKKGTATLDFNIKKGAGAGVRLEVHATVE